MVAIATIVNETRSNLAEPGVGDALDSVRTVKDVPLLPFKVRAFSWKTSSSDHGFGDRVLGGRCWQVLLELRKKLTVSELCSTFSMGILERSSSIEG